ncbi:MAG TPA: LCP family protein [Clostridiaceae bacterium]|nr:LCP family protein [Clostridiaceae bacterium]
MKFRMLIFVTCIIISALLFADGLSILSTIGNNKANLLSDNGNYSLIRHQENKRYGDPGLNLPNQGESGNQKETETEKVSDEDSLESENEEFARYSESKIVNLLILGLDEEETRTDVILFLNYNMNEGKLNILSIPRDTKVYIKGKAEKINALYAFGGVPLISATIRKITGLSADYYIKLNFKGFRKIIDTLGGVEFDVPINMHYDDPVQNLHIHLNKGRQLLNGKQAEGLVRFRKGNNGTSGYEDGDIGRIKVQQEFVKALIKQKLKFKYISKADEIFTILKEYMKTNIELSDVRYYLKGIKNFDYEKISSYTLPGDSVFQNKLWYFIYDKEKTQQLINENFYLEHVQSIQ